MGLMIAPLRFDLDFGDSIAGDGVVEFLFLQGLDVDSDSRKTWFIGFPTLSLSLGIPGGGSDNTLQC